MKDTSKDWLKEGKQKSVARVQLLDCQAIVLKMFSASSPTAPAGQASQLGVKVILKQEDFEQLVTPLTAAFASL